MKYTGDFKYQVDILEIAETSPNKYEWIKKSTVWAIAEHQSGSNIFSKIGISAKSIKFTLRRGSAYPEISLHNALVYEGSHCFLTDINRDMPGYYVLTAALIEPVICSCTRSVTTIGELNRPEVTQLEPLIFPGCLTEKYLRQTQEEPMSYSEYRFVLVTPKVITLDVGRLVTIGGFQCAVVIPHLLDEYKNEYEVVRRFDN